MNIIYTKGFIGDLDDLASALYRKEYYSHFENIELYLLFIYDSIENHIGVKRRRKTPKKLLRYGEFFITVNLNRRTTWYVFFDQMEDTYRINALFNNHLRIANALKGK